MANKKEEKKEKEREEIINEIIKYEKNHPYLHRHGIESGEYHELEDWETDELKDELSRIQELDKLLSHINLNTEINQLLKSIYIVKIGSDKTFYKDEALQEQLKESVQLLQKYKINTLKDMIEIPRIVWKEINEINEIGINYDVSDVINNIAIVLYPKYMFNIDANYELALEVKESKSSKLPDLFFDYIKIKSVEEEQEIFNIIYHGISTPEAPPAPFPIKSPYDKEMKEKKKEKEREEKYIYYITSFYYVSGEPDDSGISVIGHTFTFENAKKIAMEDANKTLSLLREFEDEYKKENDEKVEDDIIPEYENKIFDEYDRIIVGTTKEHIHYGGTSDIGDYSIIEIHKRKITEKK